MNLLRFNELAKNIYITKRFYTNRLTPMMKQYNNIKQKHQSNIK